MLNVSTCRGCGALVAEDMKELHAEFHDWLDELQAELKEADITVSRPPEYGVPPGFEVMLATVRDLRETEEEAA